MHRTLKAILAVLAAVALTGVSAVADATTALLLTREELVQRSHAVARVTVGKSVTAESEDGASIVTKTEVTVRQLLKGGSAQKYVVEQIGGTYNGKTQRLLGDGRLTPGEDAVVFLRAGDNGRWHLTALAMSVYHVDAKGTATRDLDGIHFVRRSGGSVIPVPHPHERPEPVESLMTDVVRIAGGK